MIEAGKCFTVTFNIKREREFTIRAKISLAIIRFSIWLAHFIAPFNIVVEI